MKRNLFVLSALVAATGLVQATLPYAISPAELQLLPEGCKAKLDTAQRDNKALQNQWANRVGPDTWRHLHHYCHGLKFMNRANVTFDKTDKRFYLQSAIGEFEYVITHVPSNSPILPEVNGKKKEAEMMLGRL